MLYGQPMSRSASDSTSTVSESLWPDKRLRVDADHVRPLNELVRAWRAREPQALVPWFDPDDGGVQASVLVLMESPGPATVRPGGSNFCSEDNSDGTARTFRRLREEATLPRAGYLKWNIVPWAVHGPDGQWRAPLQSDLAAARPALAQLMQALPNLRLVIAMGQPACNGLMGYLTSQPVIDPPLILAVPHPSQRNTVGRTQAEQRIRNALAFARGLST